MRETRKDIHMSTRQSFFSLWSNGAKEFLEFPDYSFEHHFRRPIPSYPPRAVIYDYLSGRAKAADIRKFIRFRTAVRHVDFDVQTQQFQVTVEDLLMRQSVEHLKFDHVIIATGHYSVANIPEFEGVAAFPGRVLHSHDFRGADEFVNQNLLIVGGGYSAEDIAMQCYKFGAKSITITYRSCPMDYKWPTNVREVPLLQRVEGRRAHFKDGTHTDELDCIIMCTGYRQHHSYLADGLRLRMSGNYFIPPNLYKGVFWLAEPRLAYLGMQNQTYTFTMFDAQAALVRDVFLGFVHLPLANDEAACRAEITDWQAREAIIPPGDHEGAADLQTAYMQDVLSCCEQSTAPRLDLKRAHEAIYKFFDDKRQNISTYRNQPFQSIYPPYKKAPITNITWMEAMDDTVEGFLDTIQQSTE